MSVPVVLFADFACPYSYVTETGLRRLEAEGAARLTCIARELHPAPAPLPAEDPPEWRSRVAPLAAEVGLILGPPPLPARTRKAHEAAAFAEARGVGAAYRAAVYAARFTEGRDIGRVDVLVELGAALGVDPGELKVVLDVDSLAARVSAEGAAAARAGVEGVPTLVAGEGDAARWWVGARPLAELRAWLREGDRSGARAP